MLSPVPTEFNESSQLIESPVIDEPSFHQFGFAGGIVTSLRDGVDNRFTVVSWTYVLLSSLCEQFLSKPIEALCCEYIVVQMNLTMWFISFLCKYFIEIYLIIFSLCVIYFTVLQIYCNFSNYGVLLQAIVAVYQLYVCCNTSNVDHNGAIVRINCGAEKWRSIVMKWYCYEVLLSWSVIVMKCYEVIVMKCFCCNS